VCNSYCYSNQP